MKRNKPLCFAIAALLMFSITASNILASEEPTDAVAALSKLYQGDEDLYVIKDKNNQVITNQFLEDTLRLYHSNRFQLIDEYINENVSEIEYIYDVKEIQLLNGDIAKQQTSRFTILSPAISGNFGFENTQVRVAYDLSGTIYYNPNTRVVNSASNPIMTVISHEMINGFDGDGAYYRHGINNYTSPGANQFSRIFNSNFNVRFEGSVGLALFYAEYAPISAALTISA